MSRAALMRRTGRGGLAGMLLAAVLAVPAAWAAPEWVLLVRHAEKAAEPGPDPALSEAGRQRAAQLADALADAGVRHILTTPWRRTRETAAPLAQRLGLESQAVPTGADHLARLAEQVRALDGVVLVVGHSNTVTPLLERLGGPRLPWLCESRHDALFAWQPGGRLLRLHYGAPSAGAGAGEPDCL